jgi:rubredoxin
MMHFSLALVLCTLPLLIEARPSTLQDIAVRSPGGISCLWIFCGDNGKKKKPEEPKPRKLPKLPQAISWVTDEQHRKWHNAIFEREAYFYNPLEGAVHGRICPSTKQIENDKECFRRDSNHPPLTGKNARALAACIYKDKTGYVQSALAASLFH